MESHLMIISPKFSYQIIHNMMSTHSTGEHREICTGKIIVIPTDNWPSSVNISQHFYL